LAQIAENCAHNIDLWFNPSFYKFFLEIGRIEIFSLDGSPPKGISGLSVIHPNLISKQSFDLEILALLQRQKNEKWAIKQAVVVREFSE
jgi:hypothetical protein